jgi:hypothetical protein
MKQAAASNDKESQSVFRLSLSDIEVDADSRKPFLSRRERAIPMRQDIDSHLANGEVVELNCEGVEATQSFMDELVGLVVLERGATSLSQLRFRKCSPDMKAIIQFVIGDRAAQHAKDPHFHAPR